MRILGFLSISLCVSAGALAAQDVNFGDDSSQWANNGECDDRRFVGSIMATILNNEDIGRDATDCSNGLSAGSLIVWSATTAAKVLRC